MLLHDRDEHIAREFQIFFREAAHDGGRHFDQVGDFGQQAFVDDGFAFDQVGGLFHLLDDQGFAFFDIDHDARIPGSHQSICQPRGLRSQASHTDAGRG